MNFLRDSLRQIWRKLHSYAVPTKHNAYRPHLLHTKWLVFFLALVLTAEGALLANVFVEQSARNYLAAVLPQDIVELTNLERGFNNVSAVKENELLTRAATAKAEDMAEKGYFAHVSPDGKEPWAWLEEAGYRYGMAGENLAVRFTESADVVRAWMDSPTHRANIVKPNYTEIGVGIAEGKYKGSRATYVVQYFGRPSLVSTTEVTIEPIAMDAAHIREHVADTLIKDSVAHTIAGVGAAPSVQAFGVLAAVAIFLTVLVVMTFVINIQVQPVELLLGGGGVAAIAIAFLVLNFWFVGSITTPQTAAVSTVWEGGVVVDEEGVYIPVEEVSTEEVEPAAKGVDTPEASVAEPAAEIPTLEAAPEEGSVEEVEEEEPIIEGDSQLAPQN